MLESVGQLGRQRRGSAIYLGEGWILTAYHAFEARKSDLVIFSDEEFMLRPDRAVRLKNPSGSGRASDTDLVMVPLLTAPDLPPLKVTQQTPFAGELVVMVGCGEFESGPGIESILTDSNRKSEPRVRPISDASAGDGDGPRWGENEISERGLRVGIPGARGETAVYATIRQPHWTKHNAQGANGDSGGGVFVKRGERWELAGVMLSVIHREDLNASGTFIADLAVYREQIEATIPEPTVLLLFSVCAGCVGLRRRRA